ncbi:microfibrillar-associated protein 2 isoform X2 [Amia ocellicauda]|uniref:microfibrillar-associated protein 2 isoform X2 n=1 Tax=Amia ocellicauda TaxID=2972642 RepID=UPI0034649246
MRASSLLLLCLPALLLAQQQYEHTDEFYPKQYNQYNPVDDYSPDLEYHGGVGAPDSLQQQILWNPEEELPETEPTEPGPLDCREEQYPCTRLYSVHKPCRQCLKSLCFYSLRRVYVVNKEVCVRTVCAHEELLRADLCRDQFSRCGVLAVSGQCGSVSSSCVKSCGGC